MLLNAQNIKKEYGIQTVLDIEKLEIEDGERIGLIGRNGIGKSTLLGVLAGRIACDEGIIRRNCEIAEILQTGDSDGEADGRFISQMKLRESAVKSGGERTRLAIASAFSKHAPLLFADEPTTNLDMEGVEMLEKMMAGYRGAILMISHDRTLLDRVCNKIWELEDGEIRVFDGNYSDWSQQKNRERNFQQFEYEQYQKEKRHLEKAADALHRKSQTMTKPPKRMGRSEWILYKGVASVQQGHVQSNKAAVLSRLEHLEKKEKPAELPHVSMKLPDAGRIHARYAATVKELTVNYGDNYVLNHATLYVESRISYFSQDQDTLDPQKTVLENVTADAVYPQHICRAVLSNLYMSRDDMFKTVSVLSGGERVKTALAKVLVSGCNFMILDEPTNHMDVYTMEGLERLLESYDGTLLAVSHDRTLVEHLADAVFRVEYGAVVPVER